MRSCFLKSIDLFNNEKSGPHLKFLRNLNEEILKDTKKPLNEH